MVTRLLVCLLVAVSLACAGGDYQIALPNGYFIARVQPSDFALVAPNGHSVVVRTVKSYMVDGALVTGQTAPSAEGEPLYFIVDTQKNSVRSNLPVSMWRDELQRLGIQSIALKEPRPLHVMRRWLTK
jgi:hypothetical protein